MITKHNKRRIFNIQFKYNFTNKGQENIFANTRNVQQIIKMILNGAELNENTMEQFAKVAK